MGPLHGFSATPYLLDKLRAAGIGENSVELVDFDHSGMIHTLVEAETVVRHVKKKGWKSLAIVAPAFHLVRAALTTASVALREYPELQLVPYAGSPLIWEEASAHSQGMVGVRAEFLKSELTRIERYSRKGDIAPLRDLEEYFVRS